MSNINKQALREAAERAESDSWGYDRDEFNEALTPSTVLALLDELEAADNNLIDSECHVAELEEALRDKQALLEASEQRIAELEARELVVNLPAYVDGRTLGYGEVNHMIDLCADAIEKAGHSAGIITKVVGG